MHPFFRGQRFDAQNLALEQGQLARSKQANGRESSPVLVSKRQMEEKILNGSDPQSLKANQGSLADTFEGDGGPLMEWQDQPRCP